MKTPHKHAALIKAWADGAEIEVERILYGWVNAPTPQWLEQAVYRIKPEPKPDVMREYVCNVYGTHAPDTSQRPNLRHVFDGETGKLKSAEVI